MTYLNVINLASQLVLAGCNALLKLLESFSDCIWSQSFLQASLGLLWVVLQQLCLQLFPGFHCGFSSVPLHTTKAPAGMAHYEVGNYYQGTSNVHAKLLRNLIMCPWLPFPLLKCPPAWHRTSAGTCLTSIPTSRVSQRPQWASAWLTLQLLKCLHACYGDLSWLPLGFHCSFLSVPLRVTDIAVGICLAYIAASRMFPCMHRGQSWRMKHEQSVGPNLDCT